MVSFMRLLHMAARRATDEGAKRIDHPDLKVTIFTVLDDTSLTELKDVWMKPLAARMKSILVSQRKVKRLPWEVAFWGGEHIDGVPTALTLDEDSDIFIDNSNCRMECAKYLPDASECGVIAFKDAKKVVWAQRDCLRSLDRYWECLGEDFVML